MKIIITGSGRVGVSVADFLAKDQHDVTIIGQDAEQLSNIRNQLEIKTILGDAISPTVLESAGANGADMLIACTSVDSTNLVSCKIAKENFNIGVSIARMRSSEYQKNSALLAPNMFSVDGVISPERSVTKHIQRLIEYPSALQIRDFCNGLASLVSVRVEITAPMINKTIAEMRASLPDLDFQIVAIYRRFHDQADHLISCDKTTVIQLYDEVFVLISKDKINSLLAVLHGYTSPIRSVIIGGGGRVGLELTKAVINIPEIEMVKIIEMKKERCLELNNLLPDEVLLLNGEVADEILLQQENIEHTDLFIALTNNDEDNIMSCLQAKRLGAKRTMNLLNRHSYADLMHGAAIDVSLAPSQVVMDEILTYVRTQNIRIIYSLRRGHAEAIELVVRGNPNNSKVIGKKIKELKLPDGVKIGIIGKNLLTDDGFKEENHGKPTVLIAYNEYIIESGDCLVIFVPDRRIVSLVERIFAISAV